MFGDGPDFLGRFQLHQIVQGEPHALPGFNILEIADAGAFQAFLQALDRFRRKAIDIFFEQRHHALRRVFGRPEARLEFSQLPGQRIELIHQRLQLIIKDILGLRRGSRPRGRSLRWRREQSLRLADPVVIMGNAAAGLNDLGQLLGRGRCEISESGDACIRKLLGVFRANTLYFLYIL